MTKQQYLRIGALAGLAACAAPAPKQTIEPTTIEPAPYATSRPAAKGKGKGGTKMAATRSASDVDFVLSRAAQDPSLRTGDILLNIGDTWFAHRAGRLKMSEAEARARDAALPTKQAPANFWDEQTAREAVATWTALCNECHGGRRALEDAMTMPEPPPGWGKGEGLFFGKRRPYAELFNIVLNGGPPRDDPEDEMPAWKNKLSREMMWSLLYFLEFQSGGIEGRFPPSLQPRRNSQVR